MNALHWAVYLVRLAFYMALSLLFRLYLLAVFLAKQAAPVLIITMAAIALFLGQDTAAPVLRRAFQPLFQALEFNENDIYVTLPLFTVAALLLAYIPLKILSGILRFLLSAFPFPQRPLPPLRRWDPPKHRIQRVACYLAVPRLPLRYWDGNTAKLSARLPERLQALLQQMERTPASGGPVNELHAAKKTNHNVSISSVA